MALTFYSDKSQIIVPSAHHTLFEISKAGLKFPTKIEILNVGLP